LAVGTHLSGLCCFEEVARVESRIKIAVNVWTVPRRDRKKGAAIEKRLPLVEDRL